MQGQSEKPFVKMADASGTTATVRSCGKDGINGTSIQRVLNMHAQADMHATLGLGIWTRIFSSIDVPDPANTRNPRILHIFMVPSPVLVAVASAAAGAAIALLWRRRRGQPTLRAAPCTFDASAPVLCFGDSLTCGYHGVWHSKYAPQTPPNPNGEELLHVRFRPYAVRLGARLAAAAGLTGFDVHVGSALRFAEERAYSGWTAAELLPRLESALRGGPWRAVVLLAGTNDIVCFGESATVALER